MTVLILQILPIFFLQKEVQRKKEKIYVYVFLHFREFR